MGKIKINRNILWAELFVQQLEKHGVKFVCISPGSRSTPLTYAFAANKKIKSFPIIDERSSGFFALGLAKTSKTPVVLVCTSGTATAEFYPAIIEAYQSKIPLIICTADRPPELQNVGANQTINQNNIYNNHIRWFIDAGLPQVCKTGLTKILTIAQKAILESSINKMGPVHINFPFKEPFEPASFTDEIENDLRTAVKKKSGSLLKLTKTSSKIDQKILKQLSHRINNQTKGIIVVGLDNYSKGFFAACNKLSKIAGYPIFADAASNMRFIFEGNHNILTSYDSYLRSETFIKNNKPDFIIQFGRNFSSKALSNFIAGCKCEKLLVNQFGDWKNPVDKSTSIIASSPEKFCRELLPLIQRKPATRNEWLNEFLEIDKTASKIKHDLIAAASFPNEVRIVYELIKHIPQNSNLMVSNSLPIRDLDLVVPLVKKNIKVFHNRGASGIDGIISTALGIAHASEEPTFLLTGDLAFYYDLNSLLTAKRYRNPLNIILINNNGGRIFEVLPISKYKNIFEEYFATPHNLDFSKLVHAFGGNYKLVKSWTGFKQLLSTKSNDKTFSVLELKTNPTESLSIRRKYYDKVISLFNHNSKKLL
ncbi:MAG: 2-succinyl-5-enolpyruvyl-6-hydroxy-3-cyclohexene-1-carboxylic-acid synthase [Ignavibacteriaceae bacterium]|nr:2-succinyl-5-enolpyruvyl-6-hydroxy-3-cyclohexene-1-carboxylic-acid synthase [Ignavibacteriaceae bacterium]